MLEIRETVKSIRSAGNESWIFRARSPEDLLVGAHPALMADALAPGESLRYLLYSPRWALAETPFGDRPAPGSYALAVTDGRLLLSWDRHDGSRPEVISISFDRCLAVELGRATLTGWLTLVWEAGSSVREHVLAFHATAGGDHFRRAVQAYREAATAPQRPRPLAPRPPGTVVESLLWREMEPILAHEERVFLRVPTRELWDERRHRRSRCLAHQALAVASDRGLLVARLAPHAFRDPLAFAIGVTAIDRRKLGRTRWSEHAVSPHEGTLVSLSMGDRRLTLATDSAGAAALHDCVVALAEGEDE